jgi:hypothetical protein
MRFSCLFEHDLLRKPYLLGGIIQSVHEAREQIPIPQKGNLL